MEGEDVFIPMTDLLGGQPRAGFGWNMLMDCLAEGRGISLPALSIAASRSVAVSVGAYARIRKQFKVPIADMEGMSSYCCLTLPSTLPHTLATLPHTLPTLSHPFSHFLILIKVPPKHHQHHQHYFVRFLCRCSRGLGPYWW